jgi:hypothetical protein
MTVEELHMLLSRKPNFGVRFQLPSGERVPDHFHVTEVARIDKNFIDCGGTRRHTESCQLQVWTADDFDHRLHAGKLADILKLAEPVLGSFLLPVEVEYGPDAATQYQVTDFDVSDDALTFVLGGKQTECLAPDKCGVSGCCPPTP